MCVRGILGPVFLVEGVNCEICGTLLEEGFNPFLQWRGCYLNSVLLTKMKHGHRAMHPKLGLPGCSTASFRPLQIKILKRHRYFRHNDMKLCDLDFWWNQLLTTRLTLWRRNYFFLNFSTPCIKNVNNTGTKQVSIMKQTAFWREKNGEYRACLKCSVLIFVE